MEWITTTLMLERLRASDDEVWGQFVSRFREPIVHFGRKLGLPEADAEDLAQETLLSFVRAYGAGTYDRDKGRLSGWLFTIAYKRVLDARRRLARDGRRRASVTEPTEFWGELPDEQAVQHAWDATWRMAVAQAALAQVRRELAPSTVRAFELVVLEGCTARQAAERLELTSNAVFVAKHRVLKRLRALEEEVAVV